MSDVHSRANSDEYRENYDRIFGKKDEKPCETCNGDPAECSKVPGLRHCEAANRESTE